MLLLALACAPPESARPAEPTDPTITDPAPPPALEVLSDDGLTADAVAAVARMPAWLEPDLALAFAQLNDEDQDRIAAEVLAVDDPYLLDEVGFAFAHLSPEVLRSDNFHPQLVVENAALIYEVDPALEYVELVEEGDPEVDADWSTTTRYRVAVDGVESAYDLDPQLYYWYVVHPRIEDEHPWYIAAWEECGRDTLECAADPATGEFWRRFLWDRAAETCPEGEVCPVLADYLPGTALLWGATEGYDAIHGVAAMMLDSPGGSRWFNFGAYGERSIQPNRIYGLGRGNCGEWSDMTTALSRTALIPNVNVVPSSWDHTWNSFWLGRWVAWEPVNWWFDHPYGSDYATYATRGDTSVMYHTEQYTTSVATLEVHVRDDAGEAVDGASVALFSPYDTSWWYAGEQITGVDGIARFPVGADKAYAVMVTHELGEHPGGGYVAIATSSIAAGKTDSFWVNLDGTKPLAPVPDEAAEPAANATVSATVTAEGRVIGTSWLHGHRSSQPGDAPPLTTWVMTGDDYDAFVSGEPFAVVPDGAVDSAVDHVVVVLNGGVTSAAALGTLDVLVTPGSAAGFVDPATLSTAFVLLPGEHVAVRIPPVE